MLLCSYFLNSYSFNVSFGSSLDLETINSFKNNFSYSGFLKARTHINDYSSSYFSNVRVKDVEVFSTFFSLGVYLRNEIPLLNTRVRKSNNFYMSSFKFFCAGVGVNYFTYPVKLISNNSNSVFKIFSGKHYISKNFSKIKNRLVVFYKQNYLNYFENSFKIIFNPIFIKIDNTLTDLALSHLGVKNLSRFEKNVKSHYIYSVGLDTSLVSTPLIYQGHHGSALTSSSLLVMPTSLFCEKSSNYLNLEGLVQKAHSAVSQDKLVRKD